MSMHSSSFDPSFFDRRFEPAKCDLNVSNFFKNKTRRGQKLASNKNLTPTETLSEANF